MTDFHHIVPASEWLCLARVVSELRVNHGEWLSLTEPVVLTHDEIDGITKTLPTKAEAFADLYVLTLLGCHEAWLEYVGAEAYVLACEHELDGICLLREDFQEQAYSEGLRVFEDCLVYWGDWLKASKIEIHLIRGDSVYFAIREFA